MQQNGPASAAYLQCDYAMKVRKHVTESTYFLKMLAPLYVKIGTESDFETFRVTERFDKYSKN